MRAVIQRVSQAEILINGTEKRKIDAGIVLLLGIMDQDTFEDSSWVIRKILNMRIFNDEKGVMNKSIIDIKGSLLIVSQFTLYASTKKGNRPSYLGAAKPDIAIPIYNDFLSAIKLESSVDIKTGEFGADMKIDLTNDGPVTIILDSKNKE